MLDSRQALEMIFDSFPEFRYLSDSNYEPDMEILFCLEMNYFAKYVWQKEINEGVNFEHLSKLLTKLFTHGDEKVRYSIEVCFVESLDTQDDETKNIELTRRWLEGLPQFLAPLDHRWAEKLNRLSPE